MHTPCPSYRTPWDDWDEELFLSEPDQPTLAICYWVAAVNGNPHEDPSPAHNHFEITVLRDPEDPDIGFTPDYPANESLLLIF